MALATRPGSSRGERPKSSRGGSALTPSFAANPVARWHSAGDAISAVHRLQKAEKEEGRLAAVAKSESTAARDGGGRGGGGVVTARDRLQLSTERRQPSAAQTARIASLGTKCHVAAKVGDATALARTIAAEPAAADWQDENSVTPLLLASAYGHLACAEVLCGAGASVDMVNCWGSTPLINAAHNAQAAVVHLLILQGAQVSVRDKDGTPLDGALRRLCRTVRGVSAATDDKHPDKPGLEAAKSSLDGLLKQSNRGPIWHKALEAAFVRLRPLLSQAPEAADALALGKVEMIGAGPPAPTTGKGDGAGGEGGKKGKQKDADAPDPPDPGRSALYAGVASYIRVIEMLRDTAAVRRDDKLRTGSGRPSGVDGGKAADGLTQKVGRVRSALAINVGLSLPDALSQANRAMGMDPSGLSLPDQADRLVEALGLS
jgi:hypothetical protein